jgi:hypothetical protein
MTTEQVIEELRRLVSRHRGDEADLLDALLSEADGWRMRRDELQENDATEEEAQDGGGWDV